MLGFDALEWNAETTKIQLLNNNNSKSGFQLHASTNGLLGDVEIVEFDA